MEVKTITTTILTAHEGMVLTNGTTYATTVYVPENADPNEWREITLEEFEKMKAGEERNANN
jgi:hypothetical protein